MAAFNPLLSLRDEALCSICLDFFKDPVSIGCGHNFCRGCLAQLWGQEDECDQNQPSTGDSFNQQVVYERYEDQDLFQHQEQARHSVGDDNRRDWDNMDMDSVQDDDEEDDQNNFQGRLVNDLRTTVFPEEERMEVGLHNHHHHHHDYHQHHQDHHQYHTHGYYYHHRDRHSYQHDCHSRERHVHRQLHPVMHAHSPRSSQVFTCPQCQKTFQSRSLRPNIQLKNMVHVIRLMCSTPPGEEQSICSKHLEALKFFCEVDEKAICVMCRESWCHKHHSVVPLEEVFQELKERKTEKPVVTHSSSAVPALGRN